MRQLLATEGLEHFDYWDILWLITFLVAIWVGGKVVTLINFPSLVGEILVGMCLGPSLLNFVPYPSAIILFGELGLLLMVVEAGLEVELDVLKTVGFRGVLVAIFGSFVPLALGFGIATGFNVDTKEALAIGATLGPTSMGVALVVLKREKVLNTPNGQLIIAACVLDDIIALVFLSLLQALNDPRAVNWYAPIISAIAFTFVLGAVAVWVLPRILSYVLPKIPKKYVERVLLALVFFAAIGLMTALHAGKSSYLLGAFLAGLMFCSVHSLMTTWHTQVKRYQTWLVRIFFAATIGFEIPIRHFWTGAVWGHGLAYWTANVGKLLTGIFAKPFNAYNFFIIGFSMSTWGEFAFIIAVAAYNNLGLLSQQEYAAVLLAVMISMISGPYLLTLVLRLSRRKRERDVEEIASKADGHTIYYILKVRVDSRWGLLPALLRTCQENDLTIVDWRSDWTYSEALFEAYLKDDILRDEEPKTPTALGLDERLEVLRAALLKELDHDPMLALQAPLDNEVDPCFAPEEQSSHFLLLDRWIPGGTSQEEWENASHPDSEEATVHRLMEEDRYKSFGVGVKPTPLDSEEEREPAVPPSPSFRGRLSVDQLVTTAHAETREFDMQRQASSDPHGLRGDIRHRREPPSSYPPTPRRYSTSE